MTYRLALALVLLLVVSGCAALAQLGGIEVCAAVGRSASAASASPTAAATVIVLAMPTAAPSALPSSALPSASADPVARP